MINNNKSILKEGFSLVEMLLLLMIASLITAGSMSVITKNTVVFLKNSSW